MRQVLFFILVPWFLFGQVQIGEDINGETFFDNSGESVSISADGSVVAIGAWANWGNGEESGHVRVYENVNETWTQIGQDIDGEAPNDWSGFDISLSDDGSIVAIGAMNNMANGLKTGHIRVYKNVNGIWTKVGQDIDGEDGGDMYGRTVCLSSDGSIVAGGAHRSDGNGTASGHVRVFENNNGFWVQIGQNIDGEATWDSSGLGVSLSDDGTVVAIGATGNDGQGTRSGHVRVYENINGIWTQIGEDIDGEAIYDSSGYSVSLSADGSVVAIGATNNDGNGMDSGHARVFENINGNWTQIGDDIDGEAEQDASGWSVSLSSNGSVLAVGAPRNDGVNGNISGHVRIYQNIHGEWIQIGQDIDGEAFGDFSGQSVSLSSDGSIVAIGAPGNHGDVTNGTDAGHVRVYDLSAVLEIEESVLSEAVLFPNPASKLITIKTSLRTTVNKINIYNNLGQIIHSTADTTIDVSSLRSGIYFVEVHTDLGIVTKKLMKN